MITFINAVVTGLSHYKAHTAALLAALSLISGLFMGSIDPVSDPESDESGRKSRSGRWTGIEEPLAPSPILAVPLVDGL